MKCVMIVELLYIMYAIQESIVIQSMLSITLDGDDERRGYEMGHVIYIHIIQSQKSNWEKELLNQKAQTENWPQNGNPTQFDASWGQDRKSRKGQSQSLDEDIGLVAAGDVTFGKCGYRYGFRVKDHLSGLGSAKSRIAYRLPNGTDKFV